MQVSVEKTSELSRKMTVKVPETLVNEKIAERLKTLARQVKIDGFRPGKVPQHVVNKLYGDRVRGEVAGDIIQSTYYDAIRDQDLKPVGQPQIQEFGEQEGFQYVAEFEVYPEISLTELDDLEIVRLHAKVEDSDIEVMIEKLQNQRKTWLEVDRASKNGDKVTISFSGISEEENFTDGSVKDFVVEIGSKHMIPGFEDNLIGLKVGDTHKFSIVFPEQYHSEKLAGKAADFDVEIFKIEEAIIPSVDDAFIKAYGIDDGSVTAFRDSIRNNMERELAQALHKKQKDNVLDAMYAKIQLTVPNVLIDEEVEHLLQPYRESAKKQKLKTLDLPADVFKEQAKRRVVLGLVLGEVIRVNEIKVDDAKVREAIENMSKSYEDPEAFVSWYYADKSRLNSVQQMVLEDQAVECLLEKAKISDETMAFSDIMSETKP